MADEGFQLAAEAAATYERHAGVLMGALADEIVAAANPRPGDRVLDVACGTGLVTRRLPSLVGSGGRVVGVDVNPAMLDVARAVCPPGIEWFHAAAQEMPFDDAEFDAELCQQGVQFFTDRAAALREMHRTLRPGGRLAATVWAPTDLNPYFGALRDVLAPTAAPDVVAAFDRAIPEDGDDMLRRAAGDAAFDDIELRLLETVADLPPLTQFVPGQISSTPYAPSFRSLDELGRRRLIRQVADSLSDYSRPDGTVRVPFTAHLLVAR